MKVPDSQISQINLFWTIEISKTFSNPKSVKTIIYRVIIDSENSFINKNNDILAIQKKISYLRRWHFFKKLVATVIFQMEYHLYGIIFRSIIASWIFFYITFLTYIQ